MMPYRESFSWAIIPLFDSNIGSASGGSASPSSPLAHSLSGLNLQEGVSEPITKVTLDGQLGYSSGNSVVVEVSNLNKVESYTEDSLQDPKRKVYKPVKGVLRLEIEKIQAANTEYDNTSDSGSITNEMDHGDRLADSTANEWRNIHSNRHHSANRGKSRRTQLPGQYLQAMVDGGFGRDVLEFLVKRDVVSYRCMAAKVTYIYPFTTAFGDSKGQEERIRKVVDQLGWDAPSFNAMD